MATPRLYVSHAPADRDRVEQLLRPVRNLPVEVALAGDRLDDETRRRDITQQLAESDLVLVFCSAAGAGDARVNQEVGYAEAAELPVLPILPRSGARPGYLADAEPVRYDESDLEETAFRLLTELRDRLEPLGDLTTPGWFLAFDCTADGCGREIQLEVDEPQAVLRTFHEHEEPLAVECPDCGTRYEFNPLTLGFVRSVCPRQEH